jgi:hypothetical protein
MKQCIQQRLGLGMAFAALVLAACGGGGGEVAVTAPIAAPVLTPTNPLVEGTQVPTSAVTSSQGAVNFANSLTTQSDDSAEPLTVGDVVLAGSDNVEPDPTI